MKSAIKLFRSQLYENNLHLDIGIICYAYCIIGTNVKREREEGLGIGEGGEWGYRKWSLISRRYPICIFDSIEEERMPSFNLTKFAYSVHHVYFILSNKKKEGNILQTLLISITNIFELFYYSSFVLRIFAYFY